MISQLLSMVLRLSSILITLELDAATNSASVTKLDRFRDSEHANAHNLYDNSGCIDMLSLATVMHYDIVHMTLMILLHTTAAQPETGFKGSLLLSNSHL